MPRRIRFLLFLSLSLLCLLLAAWLGFSQAARYEAARIAFPSGSTIASIPVGGLTRSEAGARVAQAYILTPVELLINGNAVQIEPEPAGAALDLNTMLEQADRINGQQSYWAGFWDYLWNRAPGSFETDLICDVDETRLRAYLSQLLGERYNQPPTAAVPIPGDVSFQPGQPGETLAIDAAIPEIRLALCARVDRSVTMQFNATPDLPPEPDQLKWMLETIVQVSGFEGILELYFEDLQTGESFSLAAVKGRSVNPGIAFTAASTIKIPVMVSVYKQLDGDLPLNLEQQMALMIDLSDNSSTDEVMQQVLDVNLAPIQVTRDAQSLGLDNTFLAGFFYPGAPLLDVYKTPANQRADYSTDPDIYNQTTAADMGHLLSGIQHCAETGSGLLIETFPAQLTQAECQEMVDLLAKNRKGVLIEAGLPEGTPLAHKYGWVTDSTDGLLHQASDAAIVYTPGGNYILTIYLYQSDQLQWDPSQRLAARLTTATYNYLNQWR